MTGKRVVFTGGTGKVGMYVLPHLKSKGYDLLNVDLKPLDHPGISTLIADLAHSGPGLQCHDHARPDRRVQIPECAANPSSQ
jgi:nucleoside-diphosphate-sugar epimerase